MFQSWKKVVLTGVLVLGPVVSAGAASAAPANNSYDALNSVTKQYGIDLSSLIKQYPQLGNLNSNCPGIGNVTPGNWNNGTGWNGTGAGSQGAKPGSATGGSHGSNQGSNQGTKPGSSTGGSQGSNQGSTNQSAFASRVVTLVNQERAKAGLQALTVDSALTNMALDKAKDMYANNYFDHNSPTYGSPFDMMKSYGISYSYAGENIAKGQQSPTAVMTDWMNSSGHRANILNANFTKIGVAYYNGEWVQEFIKN